MKVCSSTDSIQAGQSLSGNQTLISKSAVFEMGFFTPGDSGNYYVGIWYKKIGNQTVVWVANRDQHVPDPSLSALKLLKNGNLTLVRGSSTDVWSSNSTSTLSNSSSIVGVLLDNGNFVIRDAFNSSVVIWQIFDHPTDTSLPGVKVGYNRFTKKKMILTSKRDLNNPAPGNFSLEMGLNPTTLLFKWNESVSWIGRWTGKSFMTGYPDRKWNEFPYGVNLTLVTNEYEMYFVYVATEPDAFTRMKIETTGELCHYVWKDNSWQWLKNWCLAPNGLREFNMLCGPFSIRNIYSTTTLCACLEGFKPKRPKAWESGDGLDGCTRTTPLQCMAGDDMFVEVRDVGFISKPEALNEVNSTEACRATCLSKCSCNAYYYDVKCFIWMDDLVAIVPRLPHEIGPYWHIRMGTFPILENKAANRKTFCIVAAILLGWLLFTVLGIVLVLVKMRRFGSAFERVEDSLVLYMYRDLKVATKNFSDKLGEGGFGYVFKGTLANSTSIAVKKLKSFQQSEKQFLTEVKTIGIIQHVNLIRLRGFCAESSRRFLVYDYMSKGSLESLLFNKSATILDWKVRYHIAIGVAKGLCYLHEECRECIIHCDIKPENVLLDEECNPKLADFGLAKLIGRDFSRVVTTMRGTIGYLAPEWISGIAITPKADVYSYGMLLFELISGERNYTQVEEGMEHYFPFRVSKTLRLGEDVLPLLDCRLEGNADKEELNRACKVACWCIQDDEKNRPNMSQVVQILMGVTRVGLPPMPLLLKRLAGFSMEAITYHQETTSG
ncbi:G-type lectin S-receptor-like serine/threonine-protein kinase At2g19130 [Humulus lupulus]|uniref:G-type lectin S-receptor-like serine/threonine-protein kinase At2g19130 n=1 Tax=Humulus lupulus TaxID=3486 RepID=UPI002B411987|nr:G-type lectin S-receptor-like serine/threonine-protein kinase At2g19130 [Humulus lupulus]